MKSVSEVLDRECDSIASRGLGGTDVTEAGINRLGYVFLRAGRHGPAVRLFELNIALFPRSYNVYDSYAEAMLKTGDKDAALAGYKKSLEINPDDLLLFVSDSPGGSVWEERLEDLVLGAAEVVVPVPAAVWFLGTGLFGLIALRRRYR